jgi:hypothetical protein
LIQSLEINKVAPLPLNILDQRAADRTHVYATSLFTTSWEVFPMMHLRYGVLFLAVFSLLLASCFDQNSPLIPEQQESGSTISSGLPVGLMATVTPTVATSSLLSGFHVQFDVRVYSNNQTTFSYTVTGAGSEHALSNFSLELPDCAPALDTYSPAGATINVHPNTGYYSITWNETLGINDSRSYSITFPGDVPLGIIRTSVKASTLSETGEIAGPCDGFEISGTVYADADSNGVLSGDESGISNVTVTLMDIVGNIQTALTDANGEYAFLKVAGTYTVFIEASTAAIDFNEELAASFVPTGSVSKLVTVGPDSQNNDFGFDPQTKKIINDLDTGALLTDGESPKFWIRQLRSANSSNGKAEYDAATMAQFIAEVQGLFLPDPFQFTPGNEIKEAIAILNTKSKDPLQQMLIELLAAEFNHVSGKGLIGASELQEILLAWAESVAVQAEAGAASSSELIIMGVIGEGNTKLIGATDLLSRLNGSTGGGSGGGG